MSMDLASTRSTQSILYRCDSTGTEPRVLTDIYNEEANIAVWQRNIDAELATASEHILESNPTLQASMTVSPENAYDAVLNTLGEKQAADALCKDIAQLVDMFCCLFELKRTGLRLTALDKAMCPRFHVDRIPCRLVTTYQGTATQWLPHEHVDRSKLGRGNLGKPDEQSGFYNKSSNIQQLNPGDVALLKGELWEGNENAGLVHRSPKLNDGQNRLLLTLDFVN